MQPIFKVGELCGFNADEAKVQMPDKLVVLNLRHAVGRIEKFLGYGYEVYIRYKGEDFTLCFPECMLHAVEDTYLNRIKVSHQSEIVATGTGMYYKFGDGSMYGMDGKRYRLGVQGISEDTAQEIINRINAIRSHVKNPFEGIVFGGGRDYGKSWLKDWLETERKVVEDIVTNKKMPSFVAPRYVLKMDLDKVYARMPEPESKPESKMTKDRCIKLLEAYRAEREKVANGRKFERCLRESVVNEALERAIELLKG